MGTGYTGTLSANSEVDSTSAPYPLAIAAMCGKDCVAIASDLRFGINQQQTTAVDMKKIYKARPCDLHAMWRAPVHYAPCKSHRVTRQAPVHHGPYKSHRVTCRALVHSGPYKSHHVTWRAPVHYGPYESHRATWRALVHCCTYAQSMKLVRGGGLAEKAQFEFSTRYKYGMRIKLGKSSTLS